MNGIEISLLELGTSWMWSKILVYIFLLLFFFLLALQLQRVIIITKFWRIAVVILVTILPVSIYFLFHPIYTGDIYDQALDTKSKYKFPETKTLSIFTLKGCPHCKNTIPYMEKLHLRNDQISIRYVIIGTKDSKNPGFTDEIPVFCEKVYVNRPMEIGDVTRGNYPCFVLSQHGKAEKRWFNDGFGMRTMDEIESYFE
jgi:hypothetical protein